MLPAFPFLMMVATLVCAQVGIWFGQKMVKKLFGPLLEAQNWLADSQYQDKHGITIPNVDTNVDMWFKYCRNRYVHVTDDSLTKAIQQFERLFP